MAITSAPATASFELRTSVRETPSGTTRNPQVPFPGPLSARSVLWLCMLRWGAIGLLAIACGYGLFCAEQLKTRNDARGVGWLRGAFAFGLVGVTVLSIATFEPETFRREDIILLALWIYAVQMMIVSRQAASQAGRGGASRKHKRKRKPAKSKSHPAAPPAVDAPAEPGPTTP